MKQLLSRTQNSKPALMRAVLALAVFLLGVPAFAISSSGITYQGRLMKPNDTPVSGVTTQFRMQIRTPGSDNCVMYQELQTQDLSDSEGNFSLTLNDGSGARQDVPTYDLEQIFANKGTFTFAGSSCPTADVTYAPGADDHRILVVEFKDETMGAWEPMPPQTINYVPMALQAKNIAGFGIGNLVRVQEADGSFLSNVTPLSNANYDALKLLVAGTSGLYEKPGKLGGITVPSMGAVPGKVLGWDGSAWTVADPIAGVQAFAKTALPACAGGAYLRNNAGALECTTPAAGTTGTVTEIRTGTGLTGGPINDDGDIALATLNAGGTGFKVTYDVYGRVTSAVALVEADIPQLSTAGKVVGSAITSGTIGGSTAINTTGAINSGAITSTGLVSSSSGSFTALGTQSLQVFETTNAFKVSIVANAATGNYTLTLPPSAGANGQVLTTNGSGVLSWTSPSSGSVTSLTGDVTSTGSGAVATTIAANAVTTGKIADANVTFAKIQNVPTASIVGRYTSGSGAPESLTLGTGLALSAGGVLSSSVTDTDTFAAVTTACADGTVPLKAGGVWTCATPTPLATSSAIVQRDGTGNFAANVVTMNGAALNNAGSIVNLVNLAGSAYTLTMPVGVGTTGQVLGTSGSGQLTWTTPTVYGTGDFKADGSVPMTGNLRMNGSTSGYVSFAPSAVAGSTTYTWPSAPVAGNILSTDASGNLTWTPAGASGMTALTGDVTAAGSGSQAATIAANAVTTAKIADANVTFAKIQNIPTTSIVGRYSAGAGAPESLTLGTGLALSGAGVLSSTIVDTDTFATDLGACVNGDVPLRSGGAWACRAASQSSVANNFVMRDGTGNFAANIVTANGLYLNNAGSTVNLVNLAGSAYTLTMPVGVGTNGQVLSTSGSGQLTWSTPSVGGLTNFTESVNTAAPNATVPIVRLLASNAATNVDIALVPKGTGALTARMADGTVAGGTKRGDSAVDLQMLGHSFDASTVASGAYSVITGGVKNKASGGLSVIGGGEENYASGSYSSIAGGYANTTTGQGAFATGYLNVASGLYSFAANTRSTAESQSQSTFGQYNMPKGSETAASWVTTDPLFVVGNGTGSGASRSTALMILKNGNVGIGTTSPGSALDVKGGVRISGATSGYVGFAVPAAAGSTTYTWPAAPVAGNVLSTDGSGNLTWTAASAGGLTALTGDVTAAGSGSQAATIAANAVTTAKIADANVTFAKIQNVPTTSIVGRYSAGAGAPESLTLGTGLALSGAGVLSSTITDTDTFAAVTTACGNGTVPLKAGGVWTCATPTPLATSSAIVQRDGSGNIAANVVTMNGAALNNAGSVVNLVNLAGSAYTLTMPVGVGTNGQVLGTSGSGQLTWSTPSAGGLTNFTESVSSAAPNATVPVAQLLATNAATNVDVALTPKGAGAVTAQIADGTVANGDKRGANAVDWQTHRTSANEVASGIKSTVVGGSMNRAAGLTSTAGGQGNYASGTSSVAFGASNTASSSSAVALGWSNTASNSAAIALGYGTQASGAYSLTAGEATTAESYAQTTVGRYNMPKGSETAASWVTTDPLFVVGNGTGAGASRSTALMVLKNGNVGIGTTSPTAKLDVKGATRISGATSGYVGFAVNAAAGSTTYTWPTAPTNGYVLSTNGSGVLSWIAPSAGGSVAGADTQIQYNNSGSFGGSSSFTYDGTNFTVGTGANAMWVNGSVGSVNARAFRVSPTAAISAANETVGKLIFEAGLGEAASVEGISREAWGAGVGSAIRFNTTANGGYVLSERMRIDQNGYVGIGTTTPTQKLEISGDVLAASYLYSSDRRLKKDITPIENAAEKISTLEGVTYNWRKPASEDANRRQIGVIAQDVEKVFPESVITSKDGFKRVDYPSLVGPVVAAIKEIYAKLLDQSKEIASLKSENAKLNERLDRLEKALEQRVPAAAVEPKSKK